MPTNNKFTKVITTIVLPITGAVVVAVAANACKPEPDDNPPPVKNCTCIEKEHDALCECDADAGRCDCVVVLKNGTTKIFKETGVSVADFNAMVATFNLWQNLTDDMKTAFANNVTEVRVRPAGTAISHNDTVLTVASDSEWSDIGIYMFLNNLLSQAQRSARNTMVAQWWQLPKIIVYHYT